MVEDGLDDSPRLVDGILAGEQLNEGPIVMMIENHASGLIWALARSCPYLIEGLRRASFTGGRLTRR